MCCDPGPQRSGWSMCSIMACNNSCLKPSGGARPPHAVSG
ncbi:hypothetical protein BV133_2598 [Blastochloris viridis]|uniref:Uncharacterized protein n=1 Tax=Blastochloris viridis TaxID=1079 RepID=A0A182D5L1_BLAVI|nr:hypothetical protein BV133_2598 [Blastochloris viridis]